MAIFSGKDGNVVFASGYVTKVFDWTVDAVAESVDTTALGDAWATAQPGVKSWSGTYSAHLDNSALLGSTTVTVGDTSVFALGYTAGSATFNFDSDAAATLQGGLVGSIFITGASVTASVGGESTRIAFTFQGTGDLKLTTA